MIAVRLGDRIQEVRYDPIAQADVVAQRVFDVHLHEALDTLTDNYVSSESDESAKRFAEELATKLLAPASPVLCVVGPMGCGKSTTNAKVALVEVLGREHDCGEVCGMGKRRLVAVLDFNNHPEISDLTGEKLTDAILDLVGTALRAALVKAGGVSESEELVDFWEKELNEYDTAVSKSKAFQRLIVAVPQTIGVQKDRLRTPDLEERRKAVGTLSLSETLDYLTRLWGYIIARKYHGRHGCAFIVLDNADSLRPLVQHKVVELVLKHARVTGPQFVILLRPEAFAHVGLGTGVVDVVAHHGASPLDVFRDRLRRFCSAPEQFFRDTDRLTSSQRTLLVNFMRVVNRTIGIDMHEAFTDFLEAAAGRSVRTGLLIAPALFQVSESRMKEVVQRPETLSGYDLVRECLRCGEPQVKWTPRSSFQHLFRVHSIGHGPVLVKPRVLALAGRRKSGIRVSEICTTLMGFSYDRHLVRDAINELMSTHCQLIRSDGSDHYDPAIDVEEYNGDAVMLTEMGAGYTRELLTSTDYLQEVMLDTYVDGDRFPDPVPFSYLYDKLRILYQFLNEISRIDALECAIFVEKYTKHAYVEVFGTHTLARDMLEGAYPSLSRVITTAAKNSPDLGPLYEGLLSSFASCCLAAEEANSSLLGIDIESVVPASDASTALRPPAARH